jgi:hypothetical protein
MGLWNRVLGFGKDADKYYILLSPNISVLLPKSNFSIFLIKNGKIVFIIFLLKKYCHFVAHFAILLKIREPRGMIHLTDRHY